MGAAPQAGIRHRHRDLPALRRPAAGHRQHRGARNDRADSRAPRQGRRARRSGASEPCAASGRFVALTYAPPSYRDGTGGFWLAAGCASISRSNAKIHKPNHVTMGRSAAPPCRFATSAPAHIRSLPRISFTRTARLNRLSAVLVRAAAYLGIAHGLTLQHVGDQEVLACEDLTNDVITRVRRLSWTSSRTEGAAHLPRIAFALSEELERRVSLAEIRSIVGVLPDTQWIDEA